MKRLFAFTCASLFALTPAVASGQAETALTGQAALDGIIGNTLHLAPKEELPFSLEIIVYFAPNGRAFMRELINGEINDPRGGTPSHWSIDDQERLCVVDEGKTPRPERDCLGMMVTGDSVQSVPPKEFKDLRVTIVEGNPYEL